MGCGHADLELAISRYRLCNTWFTSQHHLFIISGGIGHLLQPGMVVRAGYRHPELE